MKVFHIETMVDECTTPSRDNEDASSLARFHLATVHHPAVLALLAIFLRDHRLKSRRQFRHPESTMQTSLWRRLSCGHGRSG